jgi:thioredoxin-dependent peroxiredoxin
VNVHDGARSAVRARGASSRPRHCRTGRHFDKLLRVIHSLQRTAKHKVAMPVVWQQGQDVIIVPSLSDADAKDLFPSGWKTVKPYLRSSRSPSRSTTRR